MNIGLIIMIGVMVILIITIRALVIWARPKQPPVQAASHKTDEAHASSAHKEEHKEDHKQSGIQKFFSWIWGAIVGILWAVVPIAIVVIAVQMCSMRPSKPIVQKSLNPYAKTWTMVIIDKGSSQRHSTLATTAIVTPPSVNTLSWRYQIMDHWVVFDEDLGVNKPLGKWDDGSQQGFFRVDGHDAPLASLSDWESEIKGDLWNPEDNLNQPAPHRFVLRPNPW